MTEYGLVTMTIVAITFFVSYKGFNDQMFRNKLLFHPASVSEFGQYYRFFTSGFLHGSWMHFGINMFVLWSFGEGLERNMMALFGDMMGRNLFIFIYFGAIVFGSLPLFLKHKNNQYYSALGASGGVAGVVFALMVMAPWSGITFIFLPFFDIPFVIFGILYLVYESYQSKNSNGRIAHDAHIWGAIFGLISIIVITYLLRPEFLNFFWQQLLAGPLIEN